MPVMKYVLICVCVKENVWFNGFFSQTDFWLSSAVAPAKLLSPHTLCTHFLCVCVCERWREDERRESQLSKGAIITCVYVCTRNGPHVSFFPSWGRENPDREIPHLSSSFHLTTSGVT